MVYFLYYYYYIHYITIFLYITIYCILLSRNLIITSDNHMLFIDTYNIVVVFSLLYYY